MSETRPDTNISSAHPPKTIIFDMGRVIVNFDFARAWQRFSALTGLEEAELRARLGRDDVLLRYERGDLNTSEFVAMMSERLGYRFAREEFLQAWSCIFDPGTILPLELFAHLRQHHRLLLLSNTSDMHVEFLKRNWTFFQYFHRCLYSFEVQAMKPEPAIFEAALLDADGGPEDCFFTDDTPAYVAGARALGIDAVLFTGKEDLYRELRQRGVSLPSH
jgi:glucose-1-phosphatase